MDWREVRYLWSPERGEALIIRDGEPDPGRQAFRMWQKGREPRLDGLAWDAPEIVAKVFVEFHTLAVRDRIPLDVLHREFLKVRQYRRFVAPEVPGAEFE